MQKKFKQERQSSVTQGMKICLATTCKLLQIPRHLGQAVKAALLCKEEAATKILSTVPETKYPGSNFYQYFSSNLIVLGLTTSAKALRGLIIPMSEESLNAIDDIGQYHFPKKL